MHSWPLSNEGFFFIVPHHLWLGSSIYNGHLWGPVTHTPVAKRLAVELSLTVFFFYLGLFWLGFKHPTFRMRGERSNRLLHRGGEINTHLVNLKSRKIVHRHHIILMICQINCQMTNWPIDFKGSTSFSVQLSIALSTFGNSHLLHATSTQTTTCNLFWKKYLEGLIDLLF